MIPISDDNPRGYIPFVNYIFVAGNILAYFFWQQPTEEFVRHFGLVPVHLFRQPLNAQTWMSFFTSMFMHGDLGHLFGNMLYLWIFGDNIEYALGHLRYILFYVLVGIGAAALQIISHPLSDIPMIGASGAISGVLGAYLLKFPRNRISVLFFFIFIIRVVKIPALIVLSFWFLLQLYSGYLSAYPGAGGGVAWFAHIGGFISGLILVKLLEPKHY